MPIETETLDFGDGGVEPTGAPGLVTLFAPDVDRVPSAAVLTQHPMVLGREPPPGGVTLPFGSVSRVHARVILRGAEIAVDDLESRNGTFVNGRRVHKAVLHDGDELRVGEVVFKVVETDADRFLGRALRGVVPEAPFEALRGGPSMDCVRRELLRVARANLSVLVLGETGTGKELVASALHAISGRPGRLATVNCAAIPATLLESELFGYKRGAFTGADRDRVGLVRSADRGTLFLDEIGDMPLDAQAKLLRMIETRTITPLGSHTAEPVDVRIVSATHRPLARFVREERFRADLFARISGHVIELPPLRERKEDVFQLVNLFLERAGATHLRVAPSFYLGLVDYDWPFNVRELETSVRRAVALSDGALDASHLPPAAIEAQASHLPPAAASEPTVGRSTAAPSEEALRALLERHSGNVAAVAREVGKERMQIHRWMKRYAISPDEFRRP